LTIKNSEGLISIARESLLVQSEAIKNLADVIDDCFIQLVLKIFKSKGNLFLTGIGKSGLIAQKTVATLNSIGIPAFILNSVDALHGDIGKVRTNDIVICLSKSGTTPEIVTLIRHLKHFGVYRVAWTSDLESQLSKEADLTIHTPVKSEVSKDNLIPTTSTTVQLCIGDALAVCLLELKKFDMESLALYHPSGFIGKQLTLTLEGMLTNHQRSHVGHNTPVKTVIVEISRNRLGATVVIKDSQIIGIITDGDIRRTVEHHDTLGVLKASDIMTENPIMMPTQTLARDALWRMKKQKINQLIVHDSELNYVGLVHLMDFIKEGL